MRPTIFYGNEWSDIFYAILYAVDLYTTYFCPKNIPSKISVPKETCRWRVSTCRRFIYPTFACVDLYTPYYIHPEKYPPRKISAPKISTPKISAPRRDAPFGTSPISRKTFRRFIYPTFACVDLYTTYYIRPKNIRRKETCRWRVSTCRRFIYPILYPPHIISTPKNIRPKNIHPEKYSPRVETRHSARLLQYQYPRKTFRRFIYPILYPARKYPPRVKTRHSPRLPPR